MNYERNFRHLESVSEGVRAEREERGVEDGEKGRGKTEGKCFSETATIELRE